MPSWSVPGVYSWAVPAGVTQLLDVVALGAAGGDDWSGWASGGLGARLEVATLDVTPGMTLTIVVGDIGATGDDTDDGSGAEGAGAEGGNGPTTGSIGTHFAAAGEGRSGGGGGGGMSGFWWELSTSVVIVGAGGGGGAGGSVSAPIPGGAGGDSAGPGGDGTGSFIGLGGNKPLYGNAGGLEGSNTTPASRGRKGRTANGGWTVEQTHGGGGGGGSGTNASAGGGGSRNHVNPSTLGSGGGGGGGNSRLQSSFDSTGLDVVQGVNPGSGLVSFTYRRRGYRGIGLVRGSRG